MSRSSLLVSALAVALAACASSLQAAPAGPSSSPQPAAAPAAAPPPAATTTPATPASAVGVYDFSTNVQGMAVTGVVTITSQGSALGGKISTSATPDVPITSVTVEGQKIVVAAESPDGDVTIEMVMTGQDFTGQWWYAGQSGPLSGRKR